MQMMKSTTTYRKWDIVLVPFPFTNLTTAKKRPALIVSPNEYNDKLDVVIAFITSKMDLEYRLGDYKIQDWTEANLPRPSMMRMKYATIDKSIIIKKLGRLNTKDIEEVTKILILFFTK